MEESLKVVKFIECSELNFEEEIGEIVFTDNLNTISLLDYCISKKINHIVQRSNLNYAAEILVSEKMLRSKDLIFKYPLSVIHGEDSPDLTTEEKLLKISYHISSAVEKSSLLNHLKNYISDISKSSTLLDDILNTADELFTNAIYNAPYVTFDNSKSGIDRNFKKAVIEKDKQPYFFAGHDHERVVIGCADHYGSLNIENLLMRIKRCYEDNLSNVINYGTGGAGIGAYLIFESSCSLYLSVKKGERTTICCSFPYMMSSNKRSRIPKNLHIFNS